jgi:hypothetical protein
MIETLSLFFIQIQNAVWRGRTSVSIPREYSGHATEKRPQMRDQT